MKVMSQAGSSIKPIKHKKTYKAGERVVLKFKDLENFGPLFCSNSYGSVAVLPTKNQHLITYQLPSIMTKRKGVVSWHLKDKENIISGQIKIIAHIDPEKIDTYLGPPSIITGRDELSMLIAIPTDSLDNPLIDNTPVEVKRSNKTEIITDRVVTENLIAFKRYYSSDRNEKVLVSATCKDISSKEKTLLIKPSNPEGFKIKANRTHSFADGNQLTFLSTSTIYDTHDNFVSDGTFVSFIIKDENGNQFLTNGTTLNGIARANIVHPDKPQEWSIKAYIEGIASSNTLKLRYLQSINDINIELDATERRINVGPIKSFMKQLIPDGFRVKLIVKHKNNVVYSSTGTTQDGVCTFHLKQSLVPSGYYDIIIETSGLKKSLKNKHI